MIDINTTFIWQLVNFFVLLYLLRRFLYGPVTEMLDKRSNKIESDLEEARKQKEKAAELRKKREQELKEARQKAQKIIDEAEDRGEERAEEIVEEARDEADRIKERRMNEIEQARQEAADQLRRQVSSLSLQVAGKFLREELDQEKHEDLIDGYLEELEEIQLGELQ